jgi:hypothetical protein
MRPYDSLPFFLKFLYANLFYILSGHFFLTSKVFLNLRPDLYNKL